jgi:ABC-type glycerol-3-phosphate transport system substrate-binding protein
MALLRSAAVAACLLLAGCGGSSNSNSDADVAGKTYCKALQRNGALLEPMSQCLREYAAATREP